MPDSLATPAIDSGDELEMLDVHDLAKLWHCSAKTIARQVQAGKIPAPRKIGVLSRWPRRDLVGWINSGCPEVKNDYAAGELAATG